MTKLGSTAHGFLKITDSGLECIPFISTGITLFMYPINLIDHCLSKLSCTQVTALSIFFEKGIMLSQSSSLLVLNQILQFQVYSSWCILCQNQIELFCRYYKQDPLEFFAATGHCCATGYCCAIEQQKLASIYNASWMSLMLLIRIFFKSPSISLKPFQNFFGVHLQDPFDLM